MDFRKRFSVGKRLGEGSFGTIYEVHDRVLNKNCVIKLEEKNRGMLRNEYTVYTKIQYQVLLFFWKNTVGTVDHVKSSPLISPLPPFYSPIWLELACPALTTPLFFLVKLCAGFYQFCQMLLTQIWRFALFVYRKKYWKTWAFRILHQ